MSDFDKVFKGLLGDLKNNGKKIGEKFQETKAKLHEFKKEFEKDVASAKESNSGLPRIKQYPLYYRIELPGYSNEDILAELEDDKILVTLNIPANEFAERFYDFKLPLLAPDQYKAQSICVNGLLIIYHAEDA